MRILRPLRRRDFAMLWLGQAASLLGDGIFTVAIAFQVLALRNDPAALSLVLLAGAVGLVACLLIGGVVSDRFDRRRVMIGADAARFAAVGLLGVLSVAGALRIWETVALMLVYGAGEAFFQPAFGAILPEIVPAEELLQANSVSAFVRPLALRFVGPAIGGALVVAGGAGTAMLADAGTFLLSMACLVAMRVRSPTVDGDRHALRELTEGWRYVRSQPWLWATLGGAAVTLLAFYGPFEVLLPVLVRNDLHGTAAGFGLVLAAGGAASMVAALFMAQRDLPRRPLAVMYVAWSVASLSLVGFSFAEATWQLMALAAVDGAGNVIGIVIWSTLMQRRVPPAMLGRVTSLDFFVSVGLTPVSFAVVGPLAAAAGTRTTLLLAGIAAPIALLAFLPLALRPSPTAPSPAAP